MAIEKLIPSEWQFSCVGKSHAVGQVTRGSLISLPLALRASDCQGLSNKHLNKVTETCLDPSRKTTLFDWLFAASEVDRWNGPQCFLDASWVILHQVMYPTKHPVSLVPTTCVHRCSSYSSQPIACLRSHSLWPCRTNTEQVVNLHTLFGETLGYIMARQRDIVIWILRAFDSLKTTSKVATVQRAKDPQPKPHSRRSENEAGCLTPNPTSTLGRVWDIKIGSQSCLGEWSLGLGCHLGGGGSVPFYRAGVQINSLTISPCNFRWHDYRNKFENVIHLVMFQNSASWGFPNVISTHALSSFVTLVLMQAMSRQNGWPESAIRPDHNAGASKIFCDLNHLIRSKCRTFKSFVTDLITMLEFLGFAATRSDPNAGLSAIFGICLWLTCNICWLSQILWVTRWNTGISEDLCDSPDQNARISWIFRDSPDQSAGTSRDTHLHKCWSSTTSYLQKRHVGQPQQRAVKRCQEC